MRNTTTRSRRWRFERRKLHIVGSPQIKIEGTPVYLDVEGLPDRDFYYLIGVRIGNGDSRDPAQPMGRWSLPTKRRFGMNFFASLRRLKAPILLHYGSFETVFLRTMHERYGEPPGTSIAAAAVKSSINVLSAMYGQVYFPAFSNGLKEIASVLGYAWKEEVLCGIESIVWRQRWDSSNDPSTKERLVRYNIQDCEALSLVTSTIRQIGCREMSDTTDASSTVAVVRADAAPYPRKRQWCYFQKPT